MPLSIGIVGLPNVGKSTLFKALTKKQVDCANYPFCTVDPNVGVVAVPDERVDKLAALTRSARKIYTTIEFVDIAGLVKGAAKGEGLGNQFLAHIRETDAVIYLLRAFKSDKIINVQETVNPVQAKEILEAEMALKDLAVLEKRLDSLTKEVRSGQKEAVREMAVMQKARGILQKGALLSGSISEEEKAVLKPYQFLTLKPCLYVLNGSDDAVLEPIKREFEKNNWPYLVLDVLNELEVSELNEDEKKELGLGHKLKIEKLIKAAYQLLNLITFFTTGPDETRAWTIARNSRAPQAGGVIHTDFEERFIRAEVVNWQKLIEAGGPGPAREKGLIRTEGKDYIVQDGDVIEIRHGA